MKKLSLALIVLALGYFLGQYLLSRPVASSVSSLLARYDLKVQNLVCRGGVASRSGHCFFEVDSAEVENIRSELAKDRTTQQPKEQTRMNEIGDAGCRPPAKQAVLLQPATQLGGGALPYLGAIVVDPTTRQGCLEFSFGYG